MHNPQSLSITNNDSSDNRIDKENLKTLYFLLVHRSDFLKHPYELLIIEELVSLADGLNVELKKYFFV